jgi:hypothetical protein
MLLWLCASVKQVDCNHQTHPVLLQRPCTCRMDNHNGHGTTAAMVSQQDTSLLLLYSTAGAHHASTPQHAVPLTPHLPPTPSYKH